MSIPDPLTMALALVEAPSPTGLEGPAVDVADDLLRDAGFHVVRQEVAPGRANLLASHGRPRAVVTTHLDTVPGNLPVCLDDGVLHGRGACDAKGIAAAMIAGAARAREAGTTDMGLLFVVGEETTSDGAVAANQLIASGEIDWSPEHALFGEPTDNRWVSAHPGVLVASVRAVGRSAHSSRPQDGVSAVHALLDVLHRLRHEDWPEDETLGATTVNIGCLQGGTAPNVIAESAVAEIMIRSASPSARMESRLRTVAASDVSVDVSCASDAVRFAAPDGEPCDPVAFSTDAPFLTRLGTPWLYGPGSISLAHADEERVSGRELERATDVYASWLAEHASRSTP